jgi:SAM-dependent methyltransferase
MPSTDSRSRFSDRVADYIATRPGYPPVVLDLLRTEANLTSTSIVADVGSGTGISAELFLRNGNTVCGVEPNQEMREAAEVLLAGYPKFHSIAGSAEDTRLRDASIDLVVAGQAFHWFDAPRARAEFHRILRSGGVVVLMWNTRRLETTPFLKAYEELLQRFGTDYREVAHTNIDLKALGRFFGPGGFRSFRLDNEQVFDREGARARLRSSSYTPAVGHPNHEPMMRELDRIFNEFNDAGTVRFEYDTQVNLGRLLLATAPPESAAIADRPGVATGAT